jgi:uncharacterized glyoxalase superfamily protein PhnB
MIGKPQRKGFQTITPYLIVSDLESYLEFLGNAFGAEETYRAKGGGGGTHLEVQIGTSRLMIGESDAGAAPSYLFLYVEDARAVFDRAKGAGATEIMPLEIGQFQEELGGAVSDPAGHSWFIAQHGPGSTAP